MSYTKKAWFVNKFDIVMCMLSPYVVMASIVLLVNNDECKYLGMALFSLLAIILIGMTFIVTHKAWGWLWLPIFVFVRTFAVLLAILCFLFLLLTWTYRSVAKEKFSNAWTQDSRSSNYREGIENAHRAETYEGLNRGLWGFLVSHTLKFCEEEN